MRPSLLLLVLFVTPGALGSSTHAYPTEAFDRYGRISWEDEKAHLDNFSIQLTMNPEYVGYFFVRVGKLSCKGEAQAHAVRAKNYLMNVRHVPWNRIVWRDGGFGDEFEITIWLMPRGSNPLFDFDRATDQHVIRDCLHRRLML